MDAKGNVTVDSLAAYVYDTITNLPAENRPNQKPIRKVEGGGNITLVTYYELAIRDQQDESEVFVKLLQGEKVFEFNIMREKDIYMIPNLRNVNLEHKNLENANLKQAELSNASLTCSRLTDSHLESAELAGANLAGANLAGANLAGANLAGAILEHADLFGANLAGANLAGAILEHADLTNTNLAGAKSQQIRSIEFYSNWCESNKC